jgi:CRP-like cAMP-binding protein
MAPRAINFKAGSIIYFIGDKASSVYLLKQGKINLVYPNIQTNEEVVDQISTGEFFGVKSGLIHSPREETAKVTVNSIVLEFMPEEFESLIMKNTRIIIKMLRVFSNQLRRIGKQVQSLVSTSISTDAASDFFQIGEYYLKKKKYKQAITVYKRYIHYYPAGKFAQLSAKRQKLAEDALEAYGEGGGPSPTLDIPASLAAEEVQEDSSTFNPNTGGEMTDAPTAGGNSSDSEEEKLYYKAVSLMGQSNYIDAYNILKSILSMPNEKIKNMARFEIGKCFYYLNKFPECIKHYSNFLSQFPNHSEINDVLFFIGHSYSKVGSRDKAKNIFKKILASTTERDSIHRKADRAMKEL